LRIALGSDSSKASSLVACQPGIVHAITSGSSCGSTASGTMAVAPSSSSLGSNLYVSASAAPPTTICSG
jgi:hypothetical protein